MALLADDPHAREIDGLYHQTAPKERDAFVRGVLDLPTLHRAPDPDPRPGDTPSHAAWVDLEFPGYGVAPELEQHRLMGRQMRYVAGAHPSEARKPEREPQNRPQHLSPTQSYNEQVLNMPLLPAGEANA